MNPNPFFKFYISITSNSKWMFLVLWCAIDLIYLPAYKAGFNGDFEGLLDYYNKYSFLEFINSKGFNVKSFYQVTHIQLYALISFFGTYRIPWYLLLTGLHALNATLIFTFSKRFFIDFKVPNGIMIAMGGALLFALNPNVSEVVVWKGGYHYLPGVLTQLLILGLTQSYLKTGTKKYALYVSILFLISTFTLEIFYLTPWFCLFVILAYKWKNLILKDRFTAALKYIFLPQISLFILYLIAFKLRFGSWIAHYGTTGDLSFTTEQLMPKFPKYLATLLAFSSHMPYEVSHPFYDYLNKPAVYYSCYLLSFLLAAMALLVFKKLPSKLQVASVLFGIMMFCMAIIAPIFFDETFQLYNSRRCYELSFPVYMLLSLGIFSLFPATKFSKVLLIIYLTAFSLMTIKKAFEWRHANALQMAVLKNYKWQKNKKVLILNMPCYYKDIRVIPTSKWDEFQENLSVFKLDTSQYKMQYISSYNMNSVWDGAHVIMQDSSTLKVTLNQWGSWWMYDLNGAQDFENEDYKLEMKDVGHEYILHLKKPAMEFTILYQVGEKWKQVNTEKIGEDQW